MRSSRWRSLAASAFFALAPCAAPGCGAPRPGGAAEAPPTPSTAPLASLSVEGGCEETFIVRDPASTTVLVVQVPGLLTRAADAELPYREVRRVGEPGLDVRLEQGNDLDHWCSDAMERPPRIDATWIGVSGTAEVVVVGRRPDLSSGGGGRPGPVDAVARLGATLLEREDGGGKRLELPPVEIAATLGAPAGG